MYRENNLSSMPLVRACLWLDRWYLTAFHKNVLMYSWSIFLLKWSSISYQLEPVVLISTVRLQMSFGSECCWLLPRGRANISQLKKNKKMKEKKRARKSFRSDCFALISASAQINSRPLFRMNCSGGLFQSMYFEPTVRGCSLQDGLIRGLVGLDTSTWVRYLHAVDKNILNLTNT